jgi:hypothetical protein
MTAGIPASPDPDSERLTTAQATLLLKMGIMKPRRLVDDLIDRLRQPGGSAWLNRALESGPLRDRGSPAELFIEGKATLDQCGDIKEGSKHILRQATTSEERLGGIAGYLLSIAAALKHHQALLTSRERSDLNEILLDLAEAAPEPFARLLSEATLVELKPA